MKIQTTNQTRLESIAHDDYEFILENVLAGMSIDEAIEAQVDGAMNDPYDEEEFDAPFNPKQLKEVYQEVFMEMLTGSATEMWGVALEHPAHYLRDEESQDGETIRVLFFDGNEHRIIVRGDNEDDEIV